MTRKRLPETRRSITHKVVIQGEHGTQEFYIIAGMYDNGKLGEIFVKEGGNESGLLDQWAIAVSAMLQRGYVLEDIVRLFSHARYEPSGMTDNPEIPMAKSPTDYIVRWLEKTFAGVEAKEQDKH